MDLSECGLKVVRQIYFSTSYMVTRKIPTYLCRFASFARSRIETSEFWRSPVYIKCTNKNASVGTIFHKYYLQACTPIVLPVDAPLVPSSPHGNYMRDSSQSAATCGPRDRESRESELPNVKRRINARCRVHWTLPRATMINIWQVQIAGSIRKLIGYQL